MGEEMNTCSTCKHWEHVPVNPLHYDEEYLDAVAHYGTCTKIQLKKPEDSYYIDPEAIDLGLLPAYTEDGSHYRATLYTLPTFGCTLHGFSLPESSTSEPIRWSLD